MLAGTAVAADQISRTDGSGTSEVRIPLTAPVKGKVGYTFMTDYIWHGINLTKTLGGHEGTGAHVGTTD